MLNLIFIDVQHSQKAVFIFEKDLNGQNHSSASHYLVKKFPQQNFQSSHHWERMKKPPPPPPPPRKKKMLTMKKFTHSHLLTPSLFILF